MLAQAIVQLKFQKENQKVNAENEVQFYELKCWCFVRNINFKTQKLIIVLNKHHTEVSVNSRDLCLKNSKLVLEVITITKTHDRYHYCFEKTVLPLGKI